MSISHWFSDSIKDLIPDWVSDLNPYKQDRVVNSSGSDMVNLSECDTAQLRVS